MQKSFGTGIYQSKEKERELVFAEDVAHTEDGAEVVIYTEALHPVERHVLDRDKFENLYQKADRVAVE